MRSVLVGKTIQMQCRNGRVYNNKELPLYKQICTEILEVNLFAFAYRLFHEDFSLSNLRGARKLERNLHETVL